MQVEPSAAAAWREAEQARRQQESHAEELAGRDGQITALKQEVDQLKQQLELLPPLRAQVEVFRTDYTTERNLRRELEQRVQEHLHTIEELKLQIRALQEPEQRDNSLQRSSEGTPAPLQPVIAEGTESLLPCPLCTEVCSSRAVYIAHVQSCADGQEVR